MKKLIITILLCTGVIANAADQSSTSSTLQFGREATEGAPQGVLPFIGAGGGYTGYDTNVQDVEGTPATIKLIGSWYLESPWVFDLGYGVNNQQFTHRSAINTSSTEGALELAARVRTTNRWQLGVIGNHFFDQGKNYAAEQADAQFVGLQVLKEFNLSPAWLARVGGRAMSETNNTGNVVMMYLVDLQIGWNPTAYKTSVKSVAAEQPMTDENLVAEEEVVAPARPVVQHRPAPILTDVAMGSLISGEQSINFSTSRYALTNQDKNRLAQVAKALEDNKDLYERVEVRGYTDPSGKAAMNDRLSQRRAQTVADILQRNGLDSSKVVAVGRGSEGASGDMKADRRAELVFIGVKDEAALKKALSSIR